MASKKTTFRLFYDQLHQKIASKRGEDNKYWDSEDWCSFLDREWSQIKKTANNEGHLYY